MVKPAVNSDSKALYRLMRSAARLKAGGIAFVIGPYLRFQGEPGEQATMFFLDPSGNALEIEAFADIAMLVAK